MCFIIFSLSDNSIFKYESNNPAPAWFLLSSKLLLERIANKLLFWDKELKLVVIVSIIVFKVLSSSLYNFIM